jgi:glycosyltransferase involved in cell wall biosynthesis
MAAPEVTVVIPARDRPAQLRACLHALARQTLGARRFEVVVVDDGSAVPLAPAAPAGLDVVLVAQRHAGSAAARNAGVGRARGAVVAFTDDDCMPDPEWLERMLASVTVDPGALHAGRVESAPGVGLLAEASQELITFLVEHDNTGAGDACFATANNLALARPLFEALGGFDARRMPIAAGEERELCERALRRGIALRLVPAARVLHANPMSFPGFLRLHHRYGRGARLLHRARPSTRRALPTRPLRFYASLVLSPLRPTPSARGLALAALLVVSQAAHAVGYATEAVAPTRARGATGPRAG